MTKTGINPGQTLLTNGKFFVAYDPDNKTAMQLPCRWVNQWCCCFPISRIQFGNHAEFLNENDRAWVINGKHYIEPSQYGRRDKIEGADKELIRLEATNSENNMVLLRYKIREENAEFIRNIKQELQREVAINRLLVSPTDPSKKRTANALKRTVTDKTHYYLAMEELPGQSLKHFFMKEGTTAGLKAATPKQILPAIKGLAEQYQTIMEAGYLPVDHRPCNIKICGAPLRLIAFDFGDYVRLGEHSAKHSDGYLDRATINSLNNTSIPRSNASCYYAFALTVMQLLPKYFTVKIADEHGQLSTVATTNAFAVATGNLKTALNDLQNMFNGTYNPSATEAPFFGKFINNCCHYLGQAPTIPTTRAAAHPAYTTVETIECSRAKPKAPKGGELTPLL